MKLQLVETVPGRLREAADVAHAGFDDLAKATLEVLLREPRASVRAIALELGVSRPVAQQRMDWLRSNGMLNVIVRTQALPDSTPARYNATFGLQVEAHALERVAPALAGLEGLHAASRVTGRYDFVAAGGAPTLADLSAFVDHTLARLPGLKHCEVYVLSPVDGQADAATKELARSPKALEAIPSRPLDELDQAIIRELAEDGRRSYTEIARKLGVPLSTVHHRATTAERAGAIRFVTLVARELVGINYEAFVALDIQGPALRQAVSQLAQRPEVQSLRRVNGRFSLIAYTSLPDQAALSRLFDEVIEPMPGLIRSECWTVLRQLRRIGRDVYTPASRAEPRPEAS